MKKLLLFAGLLTLLVSNVDATVNDSHLTRTVNDSSYFTLGVNDTLFIHPQHLGLAPPVYANAHFLSRFDAWTVWMDFPAGLLCTAASRESGMNVPYLNGDGINSVLMASLTFNATDKVFSSTITEFGYWDFDNNGTYEPYGTVKWEPGDYNPMFKMDIEVGNDFRQGYIDIMGHLTATYDWRGGTDNVWCYKSVFVKVGYRLGDANGDGNIDSSDVSAVTNYVLGRSIPDEFQADASDINGDGYLDNDDVAILIRWVLGMQGLDGIDLSEYM